jgi:hypothetical protein
MARYEEEQRGGRASGAVTRPGGGISPGPPGGGNDVVARFRAAQSAPVASAAELAAMSAPAAGLPLLGDVVQVKG